MSRFTISDLRLDGLKLIERQRVGDPRGFLSRLFSAEQLAAVGWVKPIAQIKICLECNRLESDIEIPAQKQGKQGKGKEIYYISDGLSKSFRLFINQLLKKYKFSHQIKTGS